MISCAINRFAARRHFDSGAALSARAQRHLETCAECREQFDAESKVVAALHAPESELRTPPFLRARIVNAVRQEAVASAPQSFWMPAFATVAAAVVAVVALLPSKSVGNAEVLTAALKTPIAVNAPAIDQPLEAEIARLRSDTLNAARGLAAAFLPGTE